MDQKPGPTLKQLIETQYRLVKRMKDTPVNLPTFLIMSLEVYDLSMKISKLAKQIKMGEAAC